jgi:hypothetical protein
LCLNCHAEEHDRADEARYRTWRAAAAEPGSQKSSARKSTLCQVSTDSAQATAPPPQNAEPRQPARMTTATAAASARR